MRERSVKSNPSQKNELTLVVGRLKRSMIAAFCASMSLCKRRVISVSDEAMAQNGIAFSKRLRFHTCDRSCNSRSNSPLFAGFPVIYPAVHCNFELYAT